ncbi:MAG: hypothetical protein U1E76_04790 [Planctomycetota bacterium]
MNSNKAKVLSVAVILIAIAVGVAPFVLHRPPPREPPAAAVRVARSAPPSTGGGSQPARSEVRPVPPPQPEPASEPDTESAPRARSIRAESPPPEERGAHAQPGNLWRALLADGANGLPLEGKYLILQTTLEQKVASKILAAADHAYETTLEHLGMGVPQRALAQEEKHKVLLLLNAPRYQELAALLDDDLDAAKAASYPCFSALDPLAERYHAVVQWVLSDQYARHLTMQAAAELAMRQRLRGKTIPRWFLEGVACAEGGFFDEEIATSSLAALTDQAGPLRLDQLFRSRPNGTRWILQAGLLVTYLRAAVAEGMLQTAHQELLRALREQGRDHVLYASQTLEMLLASHELDILDFMQRGGAASRARRRHGNDRR